MRRTQDGLLIINGWHFMAMIAVLLALGYVALGPACLDGHYFDTNGELKFEENRMCIFR